MVLPALDLNHATLDTFESIDQIQAVSTADMDTVQGNLDSRTNFQIVKVASHECEVSKLPNDMQRSENPINTIEVLNYSSKSNFTENKTKNKKLSTAMSLQVASSSSAEIEPSKNLSKTNFNVKCGIQTRNSSPLITLKEESLSQNSSINEDITMIEKTSTGTEKSDHDETSIKNMQTDEINKITMERTLAIRSLGTNLVFLGLVILTSVLYLVPPLDWQPYFTAANVSLLKGLQPTISTMANFGTIRSVALQYWKYLSNKIHPS